MNKQIFILNGTAGAGKDTFAELLNQYIPSKHISSITPIKQASEILGWNGEKTPEYRNFLCEFKKFLNSQGDFIWNYLDKQVEEFMADNKNRILLIDIREPEEIEKAVKRYNAKTIFISNFRAQNDAAHTGLNESDLNVQHYRYDYTIKNDSGIHDFRTNVKAFAEYISPSRQCSYCMCQNKETDEILKALLLFLS